MLLTPSRIAIRGSVSTFSFPTVRRSFDHRGHCVARGAPAGVVTIATSAAMSAQMISSIGRRRCGSCGPGVEGDDAARESLWYSIGTEGSGTAILVAARLRRRSEMNGQRRNLANMSRATVPLSPRRACLKAKSDAIW